LEKLFPSLSVYWIEEAGICLHLTVRKSFTSALDRSQEKFLSYGRIAGSTG